MFWGKKFFENFWSGLKWAQNEMFQVLWKGGEWNISYSGIKTYNWRKMFFENFFLKVWGQKWAGMGPKWGFSGVVNIQCMKLFWFLHEVSAASVIKTEPNDLSRKTLFWGFWAKRSPKCVQGFCQVLWTIDA